MRIGKDSRKRVCKACDRCKRKKIKCDGSRPCLSCIGSLSKCTYINKMDEPASLFFKDNHRFLHELQSAKYNFERLASFAGPSEASHFQRSLADVTSFCNKINPQLYLKMDPEKIRAYHGVKSIETEIIGKHSRNLNRFSSAMGDEAVSLHFGIYSPLLFFTPMGVSWMIKKLISYSEDKGTKETVYLILKFLDASSAKNEAIRKSRSISPLKSYAILHELPYDEEKLIDRIVFEIIADSKEELVAQYTQFDGDTDWFALSVHLMQHHHKGMDHLKVNNMQMIEFFEKDESILSFCTEFFERSIFARMDDMALISSSLLLLELRFWIDDFFFLDKIISCICRRCLDAGLNRWEYYVSKEEKIANAQRELWWNCFWWDKWSALISGKPSLISDEMNWCMFPSEVMQLGVDDSMDCLTLLDSVKLDPKKVEACVCFGRIFLAKLISKVFSALLYNRSFTDYRLFAMQCDGELGGISKELKTEFSGISKVLDNLQENLIPFLKANLGVSVLFDFYMHLAFAIVSCYQAMESLVARVQNLLQTDEKAKLNFSLIESRKQIFTFSTDILLSVLESDDNFVIIKYSYPMFTAMLNLTAHFLEKPRDNEVYHLSILCGIINRYNHNMGSFSSPNMKECRAWRKLRGLTLASFIVTRICCQVHMRSQGITSDQLNEKLMAYDTSCVEAVKLVLDIGCAWYQELIGNHEQSGYSKEILSHIQKSMDDFSSNKGGDPQNNKTSDIQISRSMNLADFATLESFLASDTSLDFLNSFWNDIELDIFH